MILGATDRVDDFLQYVIAVLQDTDHPNGSLRSALCRLRRPGYELVEIDGDELSASPRADGRCKGNQLTGARVDERLRQIREH